MYLVQKSKKIVSLFFLSIFSVMLLHQVLPHVHHHHHDRIGQHADDHHHHDGHGHHHEDQNENGDKKGLLNLLLGSHSHPGQVNEVYFFRNNPKQVIKTVKAVSPWVEFWAASFSYSTPGLKQVFPSDDESPPRRHFLISHALRGPPALG